MSNQFTTRIFYSACVVAIAALSGCQATKCNTCQSSCEIACAAPADCCGCNSTGAYEGSGEVMPEAPLPPPKNEAEDPPAPKKKTKKKNKKKKKSKKSKTNTA